MSIITTIKNALEQLKYKHRFFELQKDLQDFKEKTKSEIEELQAKVGEPRYVVEKIFNTKIKWFDENELNEMSMKKYYSDAQFILSSPAFTNSINKLTAIVCQEQAKQFNSIYPNNVARDVQMTVNAFELLKEELQSVSNPNKQTASNNFNKFDPV